MFGHAAFRNFENLNSLVMLLKFGLLLSMLFQIAAAVVAVSLIRRTKLNISWILISLGLILMAVRRLFDFSTLFWENPLFVKETVNPWIGILISVFVFGGVLFIRKIFILQKQIDRIKAENETKVLQTVLQTEELTRQKFARELHDGLGPLLAAVKMTLSAVDGNKLDEYNGRLVNRSIDGVETAIQSLKDISNLLSPHLLTNYGLETAIKALAGQLFGNSSIRVVLESLIGNKRYQQALEMNVFRIVAELMANSLVHANAETISLNLNESEGHLLISYADNGCGFEWASFMGEQEHSGMGLRNISSRVISLNGNLHLESEPNQGFSAEIQIPCR